MNFAQHPSFAVDGLPTKERYFAVAGIWLALLMAVVDSSIANVALPTIARDLHAAAVQSIWIVNAYNLAIVVSLLPLAALGEIITFRRIFLSGLLLFVLASIGCCFAHSVPELALARAVQGFGAAGVMAVNGALVRSIFPASQLGRGVGLNALVISIASVIGPSLASAILANASWPWLFAVNVPTGAAALLVGFFVLPSSPKSGGRLDRASTLLNVAAYGLIFAGLDMLIRGPRLAGAGAILGGFLAGWQLVRRSLPQARPLIPIDLLRVRVFALSIGTSVASFTAQMLAFVAVPFFFQMVMHRSQVQTGLLFTAWPLATGVAAPIAGRLADRHHAGLLGGFGLAALSFGLAMLASLPAHGSTASILWRLAICGFGFGFFQAPNNRILLGSVPKSRAGAAGGLLATARLTGQSIGAALAAMLFAITAHGAAFSLWLGAAMAAIGCLVSLSRMTGAPAPGEAAAAPL
jgi:DHA2 family multidrug resistance protein-like MFS transporter